MLNSNKKKQLLGAYVSTWVVIGMSLILVIIVISLAAINYKREEDYMSRILSEKGAALIRSFEAGTRTGMMGRFGTEARLLTLLKETADQPDIKYIILTDPTGKILAHSNQARLGSRLVSREVMAELDPGEQTSWRIVETSPGKKSFEVYKKFLPVLKPPSGARSMHGMHRRMHMNRGQSSSNVPEWCSPGWMQGLPAEKILDPKRRPVIFVGMDVTPFEEARAEDLRISAVTSGVLLLLGLAGFVSLYWAQNYSRSRKLLMDSRALASEVVNNLPEGLIVSDPEGKVSYLNEIAHSLLNTKDSFAAGKPAESILPKSLWKLRKQVRDRLQPVEKEITLFPKEDQKATVAASVTSIVTEEGNFAGYLFILKDLSEIRSLQDEVKRREKLAAIGNLAAGIAHEVRNPLSSIKGYATFFSTLFEEGSSNKEAAKVMASEVDRLNRVISELLEFARPSDIKVKESNVEKLIDNSLRLIAQEAESAGISINKDIQKDLKVDVDPDRLAQALLNLYVNALQAMDRGGSLEIRAQTEAEGTFSIEIADNGQGLAVEDQAKVFDPYFTTKSKGTGLGLAIVHKIVEAHGGSIQFSSSEQGTTFRLVLPVKQQKSAIEED
jgi:two-component system sensor histidine kinase HydH